MAVGGGGSSVLRTSTRRELLIPALGKEALELQLQAPVDAAASGCSQEHHS